MAAEERSRKASSQVARELDELAWETVREADPIRLSNAEPLLGVSNPTVREWIEKGMLEDFGGRPQRVGLESVLRAALIVDELRELGHDRGLVGAVLSRLESEALKGDRRFKRSLGQMRRGERGDWPEGF